MKVIQLPTTLNGRLRQVVERHGLYLGERQEVYASCWSFQLLANLFLSEDSEGGVASIAAVVPKKDLFPKVDALLKDLEETFGVELLVKIGPDF